LNTGWQERIRTPIIRLAVAFLIAVQFNCTAPAADRPIASVVVETKQEAAASVLTFAHPFKQGDISGTVVVRTGDGEIPAQVDVKRRYPDGSVKHAIISALAGPLVPGRPMTLDLHPGPQQPPAEKAVEGIPDGFSAEVLLRFPDGTERIANAAQFYDKARSPSEHFKMTEWLEGPLVSEVCIFGPPCTTAGDPDPDLLVLFGLRQFRSDKRIRVEVVVESPWLNVPGNIPYGITVSVCGTQVMSRENVGLWRHSMPYWLKDKDRNLGHFAHARWRKVFWWPDEPPQTHIRRDLPYLTSTGLIPPYDTALVISQEQLDRSIERWRQSPKDLLENGIIMAYFPTTGGREDLGPYPTWTARYLLSQDKRAFPAVLGTADLAGSFPVHIRDRKTARIFSIDQHPGFSLNPRGTLEKIPPRAAPDRPYVLAATSPYQVDNAHQPSLAFIPYLLTGEYYYLEEMYFWANWCMLIQNAAYRERQAGLIIPDQVRGQAWALRQLVDAAKIAPDDHPEKDYFDSKVRSNLRYYRRFVDGPDATPLGTYTHGASDAYVRGRTPEERRRWLTLAPWQQNFLAWSLDHAFRAGYAEAAGPRDYFTRFQVGALTNPDDYDPNFAAPYFLVVGERQGQRNTYYTTWKDLFQKTFRVVAPDVKPGLEGLDYGSSYAYIARAVLINGVTNEVPGAADALRVLEARLPRRPKVLTADPTWAFAHP
jgi:hypothetical protein